jgi:glucokinase
VVLSDGRRVARLETETPTAEGPAAIVRACQETVAAARAEAPADVATSVVGVGISSPGPLDPYAGVVCEPPNLGPAFRDIPLAAALAESTGLPAFLDRDTNVAALGEHAFGAARDVDDFVYLTVSTGVGGAIVAGGRLFHGPDGIAGELGHVQVALDGPRCGCGGEAHVEAFAGGASLAREARALVIAGASPFLAERARALGEAGELSAKDVGEAALAGDPACAELMDRARRAVAAGCVGYVHAFNPHRIVVGGSIAEAEGERLLEPIRAAIARDAFAIFARRVRVVAAGLGGDVSLAGCHPLVHSRLPVGSSTKPPTGSTTSIRSPAPAASAVVSPGGSSR